MNRTVLIIIVLLVLVGGGWLLFNNNSAAPDTTVPTGPIKVGVLGPYTGDAAVYGEPLHNTIQLAIDEINAQGGVGGRQLEPIYEDGKCDSATAVSATHKLIDVDHVQLIIGGFFSGETIPSVPVAAQAKVVMLSPSASSPDLTGISPYFFRDYPSDAKQGEVLAKLASSKGYKTVAFIQEQTDYATGLYKAFDSNFKTLGGATTNEAFPTSANDFRSIITKIKSQKPDAVFIDTQTPQAAERILKQMHELGYKPQLFVSDVTMGEPATLTANKALLEGTYGAEFVPDMTNEKLKHLVDAYKAKYQKDMPYVGYMSAAYDAVYLIKDGITQVGENGEKLAAWSRTISGWAGASGAVTIGQDGDRVSGHVAEIIHDGKTQVLTQ